MKNENKARGEKGTLMTGGEKKALYHKKKEERMKRKAERKVKELSVQDSLGFETIYSDGVCRIDERHFSKCIRFGDTNYKLAQVDDKSRIFEDWRAFYNYFDSSIPVQVTCLSRRESDEALEDAIHIAGRNDEFQEIRSEFEKVLMTQLMSGSNGRVREKYVTFTVEAPTPREARTKIGNIEADVMLNLRQMGIKVKPLDGYERLEVLNRILNEDRNAPFIFNYDLIAKTGLTTRDFVAPASFDFREKDKFTMGNTYGTVGFFQIMASEMVDEILTDLLEIDHNLIVNLHVQSIDQARAIRQIKMKITDLDKMKIEEQMKAVRAGYDMDVLPSDLVTYGAEARAVLKELQERNERLFLVTILVMTTAKSRKKLKEISFQLSSMAQQKNCAFKALDFRQEDGLISSLPIGVNRIDVNRALSTSATAVFFPFSTEELFQKGTEAIYYGRNATSGNMIMADRKKLKNPNGLILGTPGCGKSFAAKREMENAFLVTDDDIIICDPEGEYSPLVECLKGQVIKVSATSHHYINPMDINVNYSDDESPISLKADFILSLCELIIGGKEGLTPVEKTIIDRAVRSVYRGYLEHPDPSRMPVLADLNKRIRAQKEEEAERIATALDLYVEGSLSVFNHRTNVDIDNRLVCFDIRELGKQLKKIGMLIVQDQVWNRVTANRYENKSTRYYMDEFHLLLKDEQTAAYSVEIWKRFRKWGGIPTGITQNVKDLLRSNEVENILENSDFIYMLNQAGGDREILADKLGISEEQLRFVKNVGEGEGLLFYGNTIIPFKDSFPKDTKLYRIMTTKPSEIAKMNEEGR